MVCPCVTHLELRNRAVSSIARYGTVHEGVLDFHGGKVQLKVVRWPLLAYTIAFELL
jgi:hypothetical protein